PVPKIRLDRAVDAAGFQERARVGVALSDECDARPRRLHVAFGSGLPEQPHLLPELLHRDAPAVPSVGDARGHLQDGGAAAADPDRRSSRRIGTRNEWTREAGDTVASGPDLTGEKRPHRAHGFLEDLAPLLQPGLREP